MLGVWLALALAAPPSMPPPSPADIALALRIADEIERARAWDAARRQLQAVAEYAGAHARLQLMLRICNLWRLEGSLIRAQRCYQDIAESRMSTAERDELALAAYHAALLAASATKEQRLREVLLTYPRTDAARRALVALSARARQNGGAAGELDLLQNLNRALSDDHDGLSPLRAEVLVGALRAALDVGDAKLAVTLGEAARAVARGTNWLDDALYWLAHAQVAAGKLEQAVASYLELTSSFERSWLVGSYASVYHDDALFEAADILARLGQVARALALLDQLREQAPTSRLLDDGAFLAARLRFSRGDRDALAEFLAAYPRSRHVAEARRLVQAP